MDQRMLAVYDAKAGAFLPPWFVPSFGVGERAFADAVLDKESPFSKHPEDYVLFHVAEWIPDEGIVRPLLAPVELLRALSVVAKENR